MFNLNPLTLVDNMARYVAEKYVETAYNRGFYEGGKVTTANKDFYNGTSNFETTASPDRDILRARARWLSANNPIMDNIDNAIINNVIGTGIHLQSKTTNKAFNVQVEKSFKAWGNTPNMCDATGKLTFFDMQRVILKTRMVDGEIFIYKKITKDGLQLQLIEADALDVGHYTNDNRTPTGGIELDVSGRPKVYHFRDVDFKPFSIKAEYIINYHLTDRASQVRGITEYKQAIIDLKNFSAFQSASIQGARARANIAYAVKSTGGSLDPYGVDTNKRIQTVNGVSVMYLQQGEEISKLDPDSVATDYVQFSENTIRLIATARKVSYELSFRDYSKVNFASSRASILQDFKRFDFEQQHLMSYILNDVYKTFVEVEVLKGTLRKFGGADTNKMVQPKWIMPKRDLVDPLKEITAIEKKIRLNLTTETDIASSMGEDYEEILKRKSEEIKLKKKYGVPDYTLIEDEEDVTADGKTDIDNNQTGGESANDNGGKKDAKDK